MTHRITDVRGERTPYGRGAPWPERVDQALAEGVDEAEVRWVQSACVLCSNGCACDVAVREGHLVGIRGWAVDRVNRGRRGPKGLYVSWQGVDHPDHPDHLTRPLVRTGDRLVGCDWDTAGCST
jgi:predicted molibdopterin-dependent oxidoreductase YjgC